MIVAEPQRASFVQVSTLPVTRPCDLAASLRFIGSFAPCAGEQQVADRRLTKAFQVSGHCVLARIRQDAPDDRVQVELLANDPIDGDFMAAAVDRVRFYLSLDDDLTEFYRIGEADVPLRPLINRWYGYHQVKFASPWENVAWAILAQRNPMSVAARAKASLTEAVGNAVLADTETFRAFPDAEQIVALGQAEIERLIGNARKAAFLYGSAERWLTVSEESLRHASHPSVRETLLSLPGIGEWSASFVLIRGLGRMEEVPRDRALLRSAAKVYGAGLNAAELTELAARYGRWQGYWAHYLRVGA